MIILIAFLQINIRKTIYLNTEKHVDDNSDNNNNPNYLGKQYVNGHRSKVDNLSSYENRTWTELPVGLKGLSWQSTAPISQRSWLECRSGLNFSGFNFATDRYIRGPGWNAVQAWIFQALISQKLKLRAYMSWQTCLLECIFIIY